MIRHLLVAMPDCTPTASWEVITYGVRGDPNYCESLIPGTFREPDPDFRPLEFDVLADAASWGQPDPRYCRHGISPPEMCAAWRDGEDCQPRVAYEQTRGYCSGTPPRVRTPYARPVWPTLRMS